MLRFLAVKEKKEQRKKKEYQFVKESDYVPFLFYQKNTYLEDFYCYRYR